MQHGCFEAGIHAEAVHKAHCLHSIAEDQYTGLGPLMLRLCLNTNDWSECQHSSMPVRRHEQHTQKQQLHLAVSLAAHAAKEMLRSVYELQIQAGHGHFDPAPSLAPDASAASSASCALHIPAPPVRQKRTSLFPAAHPIVQWMPAMWAEITALQISVTTKSMHALSLC